MDSDSITANVGQVVAYYNRSKGVIRPALILDARLWEHYRHPRYRVQVSQESEPRYDLNMRIGYPVLTTNGTVSFTADQLHEVEQFFVNTVLKMGDLFDEQGDDKGILERKGILGERVIFKVVFPEDLNEHYDVTVPAASQVDVGQNCNPRSARKADLFAARDARIINAILKEAGVTMPDGSAVVRPQGAGNTRLTVPQDILMHLVKTAAPQLKGCEGCGTHDALISYESVASGTIMLCRSCHPRAW